MIPTNNNILFKPDEPKEFINGLLIPESARQIPDRGTIVEKGLKVTTVNIGETVHRVHKWGQEIIIDNELYFLMDAAAIIAKE